MNIGIKQRSGRVALTSKTKERSRSGIVSPSSVKTASTKLWYMHSGNIEESDPPFHILDKFSTDKSLEEVKAKLGGHHITHLCVEGDIPLSLRSCAPLLTELTLRNVSNAVVVLKLLKCSFKCLRKLDLSRNDFSKDFPEAINEWQTLEEFDISYCKLCTLPDSLKYLSQLKRLIAHHNDFSEGLPTCISKLISLVDLDLTQCHIQELPSQFQLLTRLEKLSLSYNTFTDGQFPLPVCELTNLRELEMGTCGLTDLPRSLRVLSLIENLDLSDNVFSRGLPECIPQLMSLKILRLGNCQLETLPDSFANLKSLEILNIGLNLFRSLPPVICELTKLRVLVLGCLTSTNVKLQILDSGLLALEKLAAIDCQGCEALTSPPYAVCRQGAEAIKKYYRDLSTAKGEELPVITVAVIGNTMSGKTSLIRSLQSNKRKLTYREETCPLDETTKVFQINGLELDESHLRFVDFGGHEVYHMAYQLTLKGNCIPLIVVNMEEYANMSASINPIEACRRVCFDWISHLYLACPRLQHPILVLTHKDRLPPDRFDILVTELINGVERHRQELLEEEEDLFGDSSAFCRILHLNKTTTPVFSTDHIFCFSNDPNEIDNIKALKRVLEIYCQRFNVAIPRVWELMGDYFDNRMDLPFLQLSDIEKVFPGEEQLVILQYMHNIGRVLWFEHEKKLRQYVFHRIPVITDMISLLFHHAGMSAWEERIANFRSFRYQKRTIEKEKYENLVSKFASSGIIDEAVLHNLFTTESEFPADVSLAVLHSFHLLHGPISQSPRNVYIIPYFSTKFKDESYMNNGYLQLKMDILFKGLALPKYVYQLLTVALLNRHTDGGALKYAARNGASIQHGESTTHFVHSASERKVTIQISTSADELGNSWRRFLDVHSTIIDCTTEVWKATRPVIIAYCPHCLFMRDPAPGYDVDPTWLDMDDDLVGCDLISSSTVNLTCYKDTSSENPSTIIPYSLGVPCFQISDVGKVRLRMYLEEHERFRFPLHKIMKEEGGKDGKEGRLSTPPSSAAASAAAAYSDVTNEADPDSELSDSLEYLDDCHENLDLISLRLAPCRKSKIRNLFTSNSVYKMSGPIRGRCLIINNMNFDSPASNTQAAFGRRDGSQIDVKNISFVFKALSFEMEQHADLTGQEMEGVIHSETRHKGHPIYGMFVLIIMSHGAENQVYGRDGRAVKLSTIYDLLSAYKFPAMAGKPKLVIIQACSGERLDTMGRIIYDSPTNNNTPKHTKPSPPAPSAADAGVRPPLPGKYLSTDDLYIMKASFHGFVSSRHTRSGTWFIRALVEALYKHACHRDIESLFKQVKKKVRMKSLEGYIKTLDGSGQQPTDECTFTRGRKLYLFPDYNPEPVT